jgi:hypothetical protein
LADKLRSTATQNLVYYIVKGNHGLKTLSFDPNESIFPKGNLKLQILGNKLKLALNQTMLVPGSLDFDSSFELAKIIFRIEALVEAGKLCA